SPPLFPADVVRLPGRDPQRQWRWRDLLLDRSGADAVPAARRLGDVGPEARVASRGGLAIGAATHAGLSRPPDPVLAPEGNGGDEQREPVEPDDGKTDRRRDRD